MTTYPLMIEWKKPSTLNPILLLREPNNAPSLEAEAQVLKALGGFRGCGGFRCLGV